MATLYKLPSFVSISYHKPFLYHKQQQLQQREINLATCACSIKKPRGSRKVKNNVELCNDLREFLSTFGLPEGHVPSIKELQDHGRNDLANVVRRRGYKLIRDLLSSSTESDSDELPNMEKNLAKGQDTINHSADIIATGQDEKVKDCSLSTEGTITKNHSGNIDVELEHKSGGQICMPIESAVDLSLEKKALYDVEQPDEKFQIIVKDRLLSSSLSTFEQQDEEVKCMVEDNSMSTSLYDVEQQGEEDLSMVKQFSLSAEVSIADSNLGVLNVYPDLNSNEDTSMHVETSANFSFEEKVKYDSVQDEKVGIGAEEMSLSSGVSDTQYYANVTNISGLIDNNNSCMPANSSLVEKVAKFIQNGDLDTIEDNVYGLSNGSGSGESKGFREPENMTEDHSKISSEENFENAVGESDTASTLNENLSTSMQVVPSVTVSRTLRNESPAEGLAGADVDQDLDIETNKKDNQIEINHLKFILHQKELELSQLKEQIEKEKLALSALQTKAEREISKAQKLISEKDAELLVAEESLSGLVEVEVAYCGNGEMVEVAGSFNGWHHPVRLDPQPSSSIKDHFGSRKSRLWSAMLWLYPGVYEIKFIVDGHWRVDPQMESVTKGGICNNVLRVNR
ncbi:protein PTST homolog 3, chloroplastic isoform X2 [Populus nigra]|uniref:protein PTST homolog 3, chloroplastic isoform X2 n=1 Tax=Populus nigra TaxID=3691 RepID=UPI002B275709|nr:protein PTST homolog 3, chloroplastic isoform X2 [Populus nigra]